MNKVLGKEVLFNVADTLEKYNVRYFLFLGTLLGAMREKDFIDNDNDIDLVVLYKFWKETELFKSITMDLLKKEIYLGSLMDDFTLHLVRGRESPTNPTTDVDLHYAEKIMVNAKYFYLIKGNTWRFEIPATYFFNPHTIEFLGRKFKVPKNPEEFLDKLYMDGWREKKIKDGLRYGWMVVDRDVKRIIEYSHYLIIYGDKRPPEKVLDHRNV